MKYVLENGGNIIIFPEGYWNLDDNGEEDERHLADGHKSENWLIQDFNIGVFRLAQEMQNDIVPVILHYDETGKKKGYGYRGKPFTVLPTDDVFEIKNRVWQYMVDKYYYLMEKYSCYERKQLEKNVLISQQWEMLKNELITDCDIDSINYKLDLSNEKLIGKAKVVKGIITPERAFEHMNKLIPCKEKCIFI